MGVNFSFLEFSDDRVLECPKGHKHQRFQTKDLTRDYTTFVVFPDGTLIENGYDCKGPETCCRHGITKTVKFYDFLPGTGDLCYWDVDIEKGRMKIETIRPSKEDEG